MEEIQPLIEWGLTAFKVLGPLGPLGLASLFLMLAVRFYQADFIQSFLPSRVRWSNLSDLAKFLVPVGGSLLAAVLALFGGASAPLIVPLALVVAFGSMGAHKLTKMAGGALYDSATKKNPFYEPSPFRKALSIVVPLPKANAKLYDKVP